MDKRIITIKIAARRRGAQPEVTELTLRPIHEDHALELYRELVEAVNVTIKNFKPEK